MDSIEGDFDINELAEKWAQGTLTPDEREYLEKWYAGFNEENIQLSVKKHADENALSRSILDQINKKIRHEEHDKSSDFFWRKMALAASLLLFLSIGIYWISHIRPGSQTTHDIVKDINPGSNKATLTLANGETIMLGTGKNGKLASQGGLDLNQTSNGQIAYQANHADVQTKPNEVLYNTCTTPRGGQYQLILPDGTHVWLNDASSIKFPVLFAKKERRVLISGEVYFEVAHNKEKPFFVSYQSQTIQVLGTHFNVNAYTDELTVKTTLLQGSIAISNGHTTELIKPGQQAEVSLGSDYIKIIDHANPEEAVAWKNGLFHFKKATLPAIMRQFARWYDVDVIYSGDIPKKEFTGEIQRDVNLSEALSILKFFNVDFSVEGRQITIKS